MTPMNTNDTPERLSPATGSVTPKRELSMMAWMATEGGRKCPQCGKYAKEAELGYTGGLYEIGGVLTHLSSYGHLEGYGCNRSQNVSGQTPRTQDHE
jgi:hypothetical protein